MRALVLFVPLFVSCTTAAPKPVDATSLAALPAREQALALLVQGIGEARPDVVRALVSPHYKQHNPRVADGPQGLIDFVEWLTTAPPASRPKVTMLRAFQDGDFVFTHGQYERRTKVAGFDVFRFEDGKLAEHWDAGETQPATLPSGHTMLDGPTEPTDLAATAANKERVRLFVDDVLAHGHLDKLDGFFAGDQLIEHSVGRVDGVAALRKALEEPATARHVEVKRVLGEGNFVLTQSTGTAGDKPLVIYDMFRVEDGKLAEHWSVVDEVPAKMAHGNGML
jgi:predicted SnoaL-like aldol condensation-catalyzing enzyme